MMTSFRLVVDQASFSRWLGVRWPSSLRAMMTAKVECNTPSWTIYVPVRLHAWIEAVVASFNLPPNTRLTAGHLTRGRVDMFSSNGGLLTDIRARRLLDAGLDWVSFSFDSLNKEAFEAVRIRLKFNEDLSYKEISARTGLSVGNVGYVLHHALNEIAEELAKNGLVP